MPFGDFDEDFEKETSKREYAKAEIPDDDYDCEVKSVELRETKAGDVFSFKLTILKDGPFKGKALEKAIFLAGKGETEEEKAEFHRKRVKELKVDLATLGFDVDNWTKANGRSFGSQCELACSLARGCHVAVRVKTNGTFQNVYLNKRLADKDGKPAKFGAVEMGAKAAEKAGEKEPFAIDAGAAPQQQTVPPVDDDPLPF
jgi:hypothetical protein